MTTQQSVKNAATDTYNFGHGCLKKRWGTTRPILVSFQSHTDQFGASKVALFVAKLHEATCPGLDLPSIVCCV